MLKHLSISLRAFTLSAVFFGLFFAFQSVQAASLSVADSILTQNVTCEEFAEHWHSYQNTTNPAAGFESHARIFKYRIYLHDDFMQNVDFNQLWCSSGQGWQTGCAQGIGSTVSSSGGTTIRLVRNDRRPDAEFPNYIEWNFGVNDPYGSPLISDLPGQAGTSIREGLNFVFKNDIEVGSATTTAAVWIKFMQYDQSCGARYGESAAQCWQDVEEDEVPGTTGYHWNTETHNIISNYACEEIPPALICESLDWTGTGLLAGTNGFDVNQVLASPGPNLTVTARDTAGTDITNDVEFRYTTNGPAGGFYRAGPLSLSQGRDFVSTDPTVRYDNSQPGDQLRVEVVGAESNCFASLTFPYCVDLSLNPTGAITTDGTETLNVTTTASNGQAWPFDINYSSDTPADTFNGVRGPRTLSDRVIDFVTSAISTTVRVQSSVDPGGQCIDTLTLNQVEELTCDELVITSPTPIISLEEMQAGNVEITWTTTGSAAPFGPWTVRSSNPAGIFTSQNGRTSAGSISVRVQSVSYTGTPGDVITVEESSFPRDCFDSIPSELPDDLACEDLTLTVDFDEATILDEDTACFNFTLNTSDPAGTLQATADGGTVQITLADGRSDAGNPAQITTGETTGTLCWENFQEGETITLEVLGQDQCLESYTLPSPNETPICEDLSLNPNSISIDEGDDQSGRDTLTVNVTGSDADFEGTLVIESEGACELSYNDGTGTGDRLTFDVNGTSDRVKALAENCEEDDSIRAYIQGEEDLCEDDLTVELPICEDTEVEIVYETCERENETIVIDDICDTDTIDIDVDGDDVTLTYEDCDNEEHEIDLDICKDQDVEITENICEDDREIRVRIDEEDEDFPEGVFNQFIFTFNFLVEKDQYSDNSIFFTHDEDRAFYTLEYTPAGHEDEIEFRDDMWMGALTGKLGKTDQNSGGTVRLATSYNDLIGGKNEGDRYGAKTILNFGFGEQQEVGTQGIADTVRSKYNEDNFPSFVAYRKNADGTSEYIDSCEANDTILCYDPAFSPSKDTHSVKIRNVGQTPSGSTIRIRTVGIVDSRMDCSKPGPDGCKTERFNDRATVQSYPGQIQETTSTLISLCSYLITRNAGDIYLETGLESGMDASCIDPADIVPYRNSDALIFRDGMETDGWVSNLSSYVYEIVDSVGRLISDEGNRTADSVSQSVRNASTNQGDKTSFSDWTALESSLTNRNNPSSGVLYFDGSQADSISLGNITVPEGAWTLVVENADLILNGDIQYANSGYAKNNIPSIAFVVIGGDIQISRDAHHLVGVYYTNQSFRSKGEIDRSPVNDPLEIQGSVYGYLQPLLDAAKYVGSPSEDGGGIVIRYDNRILINTPPGLSDYVDIETQQAVN